MSGKRLGRHDQEGDRHPADGLELGRQDGDGHRPFPYDGLRYPKSDEKPPFQTIEEIERQIAAGGLKPPRGRNFRRLHCGRPRSRNCWPMPSNRPPIRGFSLICMAAHTGASRSELTETYFPADSLRLAPVWAAMHIIGKIHGWAACSLA